MAYLHQFSTKAELKEKHKWLLDTADAQRYDIPDPYIYANQSDLYRLSPDLGTAIDKVGRDFGLTRLNVKRMVGEEERDIPNHPFEVLWRTPNPLQSGMEFGQSLLSSYLLNGNAIIWMNRTSEYDNPAELWYVPYEMIEPVPDGRMYIKGYNYYPGVGRKPILFPTWQIIHTKTLNPHSPFMGLSPLESLVDTIRGNLGMRSTRRKQYTEYGGAPQSILALKDWVPNEAWNDLKIEKRNAAMRNEMMLLRGVGDGITWLSRAYSSRDAELTQNLEADMKTIFNRIAPGLLQMVSTNATEANSLAARATYFETLWSFLETFAQKLTGNPVDTYGRKLKVEFDDPRVVDRKLELDEQEAYERTHTISEIRKEKYGDAPLGDERDKLLPAEIKSKASPFGGGNSQPASPDQPAENTTGQDTGDDNVSMKAALEDLERWRRMALRGKIKANAFESEYIPPAMVASIKARLVSMKDKGAIARMFDAEKSLLKPVAKLDPSQLLRGIELGVRALEVSGNGTHKV